MNSQYILQNEMQSLARVAAKLNEHIIMRESALSFSGEVHAVDVNGERIGVFYSVGDGWNFYPTGNLPEHREVSTDAMDALERLYTALEQGQGVTHDELFDILPVRDA